jgi:hypothetical protein
MKLNDYRVRINQVPLKNIYISSECYTPKILASQKMTNLLFFKFQFKPSRLQILKEQFGELLNGSYSWLNCTQILREDEHLSLAKMIPSSSGNLLYRATRDGFTASTFHSKCDGKGNTVTIIKNNLNYVFGGYTATEWTSNSTFISDSSAFVFSLRRNGVSNSHKFPIKLESNDINTNNGPFFGVGYNIFIVDRSDIQTGSQTNFGLSNKCPPEYSYGNENKKCFLSGNINSWLTTEIEVYQLSE